MITQKNKTEKTVLVPGELEENQVWNDDKMNKLKEFILTESKKQSPERKLRNELLSIKYQIQDYIEQDTVETEMRIVDFVKQYLKLLNITQRDLATAFEMKDSNLYKYLKGERKLNPDLVFKLSAFSHTRPELWYYVQTKNELCKLKRGKQELEKYKKYDYKHLVSVRGWEVDHSKPTSKGGIYEKRNLRALRTNENRKKSDKYPRH